MCGAVHGPGDCQGAVLGKGRCDSECPAGTEQGVAQQTQQHDRANRSNDCVARERGTHVVAVVVDREM